LFAAIPVLLFMLQVQPSLGLQMTKGKNKIKKEQKNKKKYLQKGKVAIGRDENRQCAEHDHCLHVG